jgi:ABC-2 type transport system permease protein
MKEWIFLLWAEMKKEHRNSFHSNLIYFSLLVWPAIKFITAYYSFLPFQLGQGSPLARFFNPDHLLLFLLTGYLGYLFFWCLVQSAWQLSFERQSGTMEIIFITPVNRLAFIYGRSFSSLAEGVWLFFTFSILGLFFIDGIQVNSWWNVPAAFFILLLSAVVWGGFLTVLFLFSRDSSFLFTALDEPMQIFAGVGIPPLAFPFWAKLISLCFPLTYTLHIMRKLLMEGTTMLAIAPELILLTAVLSLLVLVSAYLLKRAERHMKQTGSMVLY